MNCRYIFWDWNGTLLDDALATCEAVNVMLEKRNLNRLTLEEYRDLVEVPIIRFYEKVLDMSNESMEALSKEFNPLCQSLTSEHPLFPDTVELIKAINRNGIKQYIFSSSQNKYIEPFLEKYEIFDCFEAVLGATDCYVGSKVERTAEFIKNNGININETLFIGDMVHDSEVANAVNAECILVSTGHQSRESLIKTGKRVASSLSELFDIIKLKR